MRLILSHLPVAGEVVLFVKAFAEDHLPDRFPAADGAGGFDHRPGRADPTDEIVLAAKVSALENPGEGDLRTA